MLHTKTVAFIAVCAVFVAACVSADEQPKFGGTFEPTNRDYLATSQQQQLQDADNSNNITATVDAIIDTIIVTGRQGRNLDGFDDVYNDPTVQEALTKADDRQARNIIKDKLCSLGLMDCDNNIQIEGKRPSYGAPPSGAELIYSQPPPGYQQSGAPFPPQQRPQYYQQQQQQQQQPQRPPPGAYGPARPMPPPPPSHSNLNKYTGPPRKVGYAGGPSYASQLPGNGGANFQSRPPGPYYDGSSPPASLGPNFQQSGAGVGGGPLPYEGQIFEGPKPPGPIYEDNSSPYKFDTSASQVHQVQLDQHDKYETIDYPSQKIVAAQPASNTVNIHHHYHHLDGEASSDGKKTIVGVNAVGSTHGAASVVTGSGGILSSSSASGFNSLSSVGGEYGGLSSGGFSPMSSFVGGSGLSSSGSNYYNQKLQSGLSGYGNGASVAAYKPVIETSNNLLGVSGPSGIYDGSVNSYGGVINGNSGFNGQQQQYQQQQSFHSQNPDLYKKALNTAGGSSTNSLSSLSQYSKYNQFNTGENYDSRQDNFDCVCVPYEQCPSQDVIGRKDDLVLPLDPRNLKTDIEAAADETVVKSVAQNATVAAENRSDEKHDDAKAAGAEKMDGKEDTKDKKKIVKREAASVADKKSDDAALDQADGQARHFGLGGGYPSAYGGGIGLGGYGGGLGGLNPLGGKKVVPTFGVSFGLPYPSYGGGGYPINPFGGAPAVNQNFGSLSPNGLNLGLVNVNPLVSFQVAKNELGEKLFKPLVNLHVTPNANIIQKVGDLWRAKKFGFGGGPSINQHYHTHTHYPQPPEVYHPGHHHDHHGGHPYDGPYLEHPPHQSFVNGPGPFVPSGPGGFASGPGGYPSGPGGYPSGPGGYPNGPSLTGGYGFAGPQHGFYRDGSGNDQQPEQFEGPTGTNNYYDPSAGSQQYSQYDQYSGRSTYDNSTIPLHQQLPLQQQQHLQQPQQQQSQHVASYQDVFPQNTQLHSDSIGPGAYVDYASYNQQGQQPQQQQQQQQRLTATDVGQQRMVAFPNNRRRKRNADTESTDDSLKKPALVESRSTNTESSSVEKRQAYYQQQQQQRPQQQCAGRQVCCRRPQRPVQQQQQQVPSFQPGQCGRRNTNGVTGRIKNPSYIDGDSEFGEYPWQVAILKKDPKESVYICGGTLIDGQHILTAAHCVRTYSHHDLRIRLGEWDVNHDVEFFPYVERDAVSVTVHPEYYAGTLDNDLAIVRLNAPVDFANAPHISPACLPDKFTDYTGARCWTTGWGKDAFGDFGKYQNILKEVDVPIVGQQLCQQQLRSTRLGYGYQLNPGFICAGGEEGKDACKGDGGGPMVCERNGSWQLVGVVSWGIGCGQVNVPGVYVRVSHYLDWIQANTRRF